MVLIDYNKEKFYWLWMSFIWGGYLLIIVFRVTEDGDPYVRADDENYENDSVRQLENELKMEEYLKQKLQDEAYQVGEDHLLLMFLHKWERMMALKCPVPSNQPWALVWDLWVTRAATFQKLLPPFHRHTCIQPLCISKKTTCLGNTAVVHKGTREPGGTELPLSLLSAHAYQVT